MASRKSAIPQDRQRALGASASRPTKSGRGSSHARLPKSIEFDMLLFSHHAFCFVRLIFDAISDASIRLNGHLPNDGIDVCLLNDLSTPRSLSKVANAR